jgi:hypothetical protein
MKQQREGFFIGMVSSWRLHGKENNRKKGYPTNLFIKEATDANYDAAVVI